MLSHRLIRIIGSLFILTYFNSVRGEEDVSNESRLIWQAYLASVGSRNGVHFTLELASPQPARQTEDYYIKGNTKFASVDAMLTEMSKKIDWLSFKLDEKHPRIIHVMDKRLATLEGYALEQTANVEFAGVLGELGWAIHKEVVDLQPRTSGIGGEEGDDHWTEVAVSVKNAKVRRILTDAVPLNCYGPILWHTKTYLDGASKRTVVQYDGLKEFDDDPEGLRWPWWEWLNDKGRDLHCMFTIETMYREATDPKCCPVFFSKEEKFETVDALIAKLIKSVPHLTAVKDPKRPQIIHIIDKDLLKLRDYAIVRSVDIDYEGTPTGLTESLKGKVAGAGPLWVSKNEDPVDAGDTVTKISVHAKGQPLRSVLTDCIPLRDDQSVMWHARTWNRSDGPKTTIYYDWLK